jgi:cell wall-associated NlpC family hydrolase
MSFVDYAMKFIGRPYIWGGDGSGKCGSGFDCSGLVLECLWAFGLYDGPDTTAQGLYKALKKSGWKEVPFDFIAEGDVLFFGKSVGSITHTALAIGEGLMIEAGGGGSKCKTPATSTGKVQVRPIRANIIAALRKSK